MGSRGGRFVRAPTRPMRQELLGAPANIGLDLFESGRHFEFGSIDRARRITGQCGCGFNEGTGSGRRSLLRLIARWLLLVVGFLLSCETAESTEAAGEPAQRSARSCRSAGLLLLLLLLRTLVGT